MKHSSLTLGTSGVLLVGVLQILVWGGSFYLMAVLAEPVIRDTGWPGQWVYGGLSLGILVSALLAPATSKLIGRIGGRPVLASSGLVVAAGLVLLALAHSLPVFLAAWAILGVGMALGLYESLFAALGAAFGEHAGRAITSITLISGFATTVAWPLLAFMIAQLGWREACLVYAALLAVVVAPLYRLALPATPPLLRSGPTEDAGKPSIDRGTYWLLTSLFALGAILMTALSVYLVAILQARGLSLASAIALSALLGPTQVGARILQLLARKQHPIRTAYISVGFSAVGLLLLTAWPAAAAAALVVFGIGNGLRAIIRGTLPLAILSQREYVALMGPMSRPALICQALTPLAGGWLMHTLGATATLVSLCALALVNVGLTLALARRLRRA